MKTRKKIFLLFAVIAVSITSSFAQDVITLKSGKEIIGLVYEIGDNDVKYKKITNPNGPNYILKKSEIFMIRYANGSKDVFEDVTPSVPATTDQPSVQSNAQDQPLFQIDYTAKSISNSLIFIKGQNQLNVVFDYSALAIQGLPEKEFLETKDKGWVDQWEDAKKHSYYSHFLEYLNKNVNTKKTLLLCGDYPESQYQATVRVLTIKNKSEIECIVYFTMKGNPTPLAIVLISGDFNRTNIKTLHGVYPPIARVSSNSTNNSIIDILSIIRTFDYLGQDFGKIIAKQIK